MIPWLEEMRRYAQAVQTRNEVHRALQAGPQMLQACVRADQLLALIAVVEEAQGLRPGVNIEQLHQNILAALKAAERVP